MHHKHSPSTPSSRAQRQQTPSASTAVSAGARARTAVSEGLASTALSLDASPRAQAQALQLQALLGQGVAQCKSEGTVKQELANGSLLANLQGNFIVSHGQGVDTNVDAAKIHAHRAAPPPTNTVIKDLRALKQGLAGAPFASQDADNWRVTTVGAIDMVDTTKKLGAIGAEVPAPVMVPTNLEGSAFNYDGDKVAHVNGLVLGADELDHANAKAGSKPKSSAKAQVKNAYRLTFLQAVNAFRRESAAAGDLAWVKANFSDVTGTALAALAPTAINAIGPRQQRVRVFISKDSGNIWHLDGYA